MGRPGPRATAAGAPASHHAPSQAPSQAAPGTSDAGTARHERVATAAHTDTARLSAAIAASGSVADLVEVRLDALWTGPPEPDTAADALVAIADAARDAGVGLLATLRPTRQGGAWKGPEDVRLGLLVAAARAGFDVLDVEADNADMDALLPRLHDDAARCIVSDHTLAQAPLRDDGLLRLLRMQDMGQRAEKLAFPAGSFLDALRALELAHAHARRHGRPAIAPIGFGGAMLRALLALAGNRLTYGHAPGLAAAVQGQPGAADIQAVWDHWGLGPDDLDGAAASPGWFAVLGASVRHSLSPRIHNAALRAAGRPERYGALDVPDSPGAVRLVATVASRIGLSGASVTAPLKHHALAMAEPDGRAKALGAANCLRFDAAGAHATNTDAAAFERLFAAQRDATRSVLVLGAGGAARAALAAARAQGLAATFTSRDAARASQVATDLGARWVPWDGRADVKADAIVQATPVGPADQDPLLPAASFADASAAIELVYVDGPTAFEVAARTAGLPVVDGRAFLVEQAVDAYRFWTGDDPDRAAMEAALAGPQAGARPTAGRPPGRPRVGAGKEAAP